jgi:hypothetical protein
MPIFMIERRYAEQLDVDEASVAEINQINAEEGVRWLSSFLSLDKRKTFCLYESPSAEAIHSAAQRAGLPADSVVELAGEIAPDGAFTAMGAT